MPGRSWIACGLVAMLVLNGPVSADRSAAESLIKEEKYTAAVRELQPHANSGENWAMWELAKINLRTDFPGADPIVGVTLLRSVGKKLPTEKRRQLSWNFEQNSTQFTKNSWSKVAVEWANAALAEGYTEAPMWLSGIYLSRAHNSVGEAAENFRISAEKVLKKAAESENVDAMFNLAEFYHNNGFRPRFKDGKKIAINNSRYQKALPWYRRGAENGHPLCMAMLITYFGIGHAEPNDSAEPYFWSRMAIMLMPGTISAHQYQKFRGELPEDRIKTQDRRVDELFLKIVGPIAKKLNVPVQQLLETSKANLP